MGTKQKNLLGISMCWFWGLARRGFAVESAVARICREGGGRVATNRMIRDLDLAIPSAGIPGASKSLWMAFSLFGGAQLAVDATMVSPVRADGLPREGAAARDGGSHHSRQRKERTYLELSGHQHRCRLVVLATEVGGRWSLETRDFLRALAVDRARLNHSCTREWNRHGGCGGGPSCRELLEFWFFHWWTSGWWQPSSGA